MSGFSSLRRVKATRKACRCGQCLQWIDAGQPKVVASGRYDGDFYASSEHPECHAAARALYASPHWPDDEEFPVLINDVDSRDDGDWLRSEHPIVAERLGLATPTP